jgi:hypothetical protein
MASDTLVRRGNKLGELPARLSRPMKRPRARLDLLVAASLLAAVTLSSCGASTSNAQHSESVHESVKTDAALLAVTISAGNIHLVPGPAGHVTLQGTVTYRGDRRPSLWWEKSSTRLALHSVCRSEDQSCGYNYTFALPASTRVAASTNAGDMSAEGLTGPLKLGSAAGNVTLDHLSGATNVTDAAGNVTATHLREGSTDISEGGGNVYAEFTAAPSRVFIKDSTGNVDVLVPGSCRYHVSTTDTLGNVVTSIQDDPTSHRVISLSVGTGNVSLNYTGSAGLG